MEVHGVSPVATNTTTISPDNRADGNVKQFAKQLRRFRKLADNVLLKRTQWQHEHHKLENHERVFSESAKRFLTTQLSERFLEDFEGLQKDSEAFQKGFEALQKQEEVTRNMGDNLRFQELQLANIGEVVLTSIHYNAPYLAAFRSDQSTVSTTQPVPTDMPSLVREYFDRRGEVGIYRERLEELDMEHSEFSALRSAHMCVSDDEFTLHYEQRRQKIDSDLQAAQDETARLANQCKETLGFYPESGLTNSRIESSGYNLVDPYIDGVLDGIHISALADSGAAANFVSLSYAKRHGLTIDSSKTGTAKTANGKPVEIVGTTDLEFSFKGEVDRHLLTFNVVRRSLFDVILGSPFLTLTQSLTRLSYRICRKIRKCLMYQIRYLGTPQQVIHGCFNGIEVDAALDTGSQGNFISKEFAENNGLRFDHNRDRQVELEFFDGSRDTTCGVLVDVTWSYGSPGADTYHPIFYVVDGLQHNVLLGDSLINSTEAFTRHEKHIKVFADEDIRDRDWTLSPILIKKRKDKDVILDPYEQWESQRQKMFTERDEMERKLSLVPEEQRAEEWNKYLNQWQEKMVELGKVEPRVTKRNDAPSQEPMQSVLAQSSVPRVQLMPDRDLSSPLSSESTSGFSADASQFSGPTSTDIPGRYAAHRTKRNADPGRTAVGSNEHSNRLLSRLLGRRRGQ